MHRLTQTLLAAQLRQSSIPYVEASLSNRWGGVAQLTWERIYSGPEPDEGSRSALSSAKTGALLRVRTDPGAGTLYAQRVTNPAPGSPFGAWQDLGTTSPTAGIALAQLDASTLLFDVAPNRRTIRERRSRDDGVTLSAPGTIVAASREVHAIAAAASPSGSALLLYADSAGRIYSVKRTGGAWTSPQLWTNSLSSVHGIACAYIDGDWAVICCGTAPDGSAGVWTCILGDGNAQAADTWSSLREVIAAAAGSRVTYRTPSLCVGDRPSMTFVEAYGGSGGYSNTLVSYAPAGARFANHRWREPSPFPLSSDIGPALTADSRYVYLTTPSGVWRAAFATNKTDISDAVISADVRETPRGARARIELDNRSGVYSTGEGGALQLGQEVSIAWGYETAAGRETAQPQRYWLREARREARAGSAVTVLEAEDAWWFLGSMRARRQLTWPAHTTSVQQIFGRLLTMAGLSATLSGSSPAIVATYPAMTISPNESLALGINRLMTRVPDLLRFSDGALEAIHARATDLPVYAYGGERGHAVLEARESSALSPVNHVQVYGDGALGQAMNQPELERVGNLLVQVIDRSLTTADAATSRAQDELRARGVLTPHARITVPVNAGQQLYDVISVTDPVIGWTGESMRVAGLRTRYSIGGARPIYQQELDLGGV